MTVSKFTPQAFVTALITVEKELPKEMITAIQEVGQACQNGNIQSLSQLREIAKLDPDDFYQVYQSAYKELLAIDEAKEKNKHISDPLPTPVKPNGNEEPNILASLGPILGDNNPAQKAKNIFGTNSLKPDMATVVRWCAENIRLS